MADVAENAPFTDPVTAILQGKRHLLVRDYDMAVTALAQACELLAAKHGDASDELGEPYLLYGRALLGLAREEAGVLGGGVPGSEEVIEEDDEEGEEEDGEEEEDGDTQKESNNDSKNKDDSSETKTLDDKETKKADDKDAKKTDRKDAKKEDAGGEAAKKADDKDAKKADGKDTKNVDEKDVKKADDSESKKADDKDTEKKGTTKTAKVEEKKDPDVPLASSSKSTDHQNGAAAIEETTNEEDDVNNLQVAWEVLELAKLVLLKRGPPGWKHLAEAHRLLGEVAMEGGNHQGALIDLKACLDLLNKIDPIEPRAIAEIHYQLGLAYSLGNEFDLSVEEFNKATELLEKRIQELEALNEDELPKSEDPFYTVKGEIEELKELLPEIQEKITDMKDFKQETHRLLVEGIKNHVAAGSNSNGAGPSHDESGGSSCVVKKPASDISHLVKRKRPATEDEKEETGTNPSPCKKPTPEKIV